MNAFDVYVKRRSDLIKKLRRHGCTQQQAEDAVSEAILKMLVYIGKGEEVKHPYTFLLRTACNALVDERRRLRTKSTIETPVEDLPLPHTAPGPEQEAEDQISLQRTIDTLSASLDKRSCSIFLLHCYLDLTYEEIAEQLGVTKHCVRKAIAAASYVLTMKDCSRPR